MNCLRAEVGWKQGCEPREVLERHSQSEQLRAGEGGRPAGGCRCGRADYTENCLPVSCPPLFLEVAQSGRADRLGPELPGGREGHTASHLPWPLPSSSLCLSRASGQSSISRKRLCWAVGQATPCFLLTPPGKGCDRPDPSGQDVGLAVLLLERALQPPKVPTPVGSGLPAHLGTPT